MSDIGGVFREPGLQTSSSKSNDRVLSSPQSSSHLTLKYKLINIFCSNLQNHVETRFRVCNQGTCGHTLQLLYVGQCPQQIVISRLTTLSEIWALILNENGFISNENVLIKNENGFISNENVLI